MFFTPHPREVVHMLKTFILLTLRTTEISRSLNIIETADRMGEVAVRLLKDPEAKPIMCPIKTYVLEHPDQKFKADGNTTVIAVLDSYLNLYKHFTFEPEVAPPNMWAAAFEKRLGIGRGCKTPEQMERCVRQAIQVYAKSGNRPWGPAKKERRHLANRPTPVDRNPGMHAYAHGA